MTTDVTEAVEAFVAALRTAEASLREVPGKLEGARVHDFAFGKMFEATEVRDAYHNRLPETEKDIVEACEVIDHFVSGLEGGHAVGANPGGPDPAQSQAAEWAPGSYPWHRTIPRQAGGADA
ncbi:hypothetical protein [Catenulispora pinisilvae]|uniref:hypothetical protein n=1 Tax=Catenulispora pinisilvae TaxID=2705253 RepID=UPI001890D74E|nr:hypothetical protein [Catenulispora pinisilvae]